MSFSIALSLAKFPTHATIIGDLLLGYADLEFFTVDLVAQAIGGDDHDKAVRILYRLKGSYDRLNVADAMLRPFFDGIGLKGAYGQWLGAMRKCRVIRNQYAHCGWRTGEDRLWFANLEEAAEPAEGTAGLLWSPVDMLLLKEQQAYFKYTVKVTFYLMDEARFRRDRRRRHKTPLPKSRAVPSLHSPLS